MSSLLRKPQLTLTFIVNNNHVYPVTDPVLSLHIAKTKKLDFTTMQFSAGDEECLLRHVGSGFECKRRAFWVGNEKLMHVETDDLCPVLKDVVAQTGYNPVAIMSSGPFVTAFQHPVTNQVYIASQDYLLEKRVRCIVTGGDQLHRLRLDQSELG